MSTGELKRAVGCNSGNLRRLLATMVVSGHILVRTVQSVHGDTKMHRLSED